MKILADANMAGVEAYFSRLGDVSLFEGRTLASEQLAEADVLLVRSVTPVNAALLGDHRLRFIGSATSGYDHVDRKLLANLDIPFAHAPGSNADSVVDYVLSVLCQHPTQLDALLGGSAIGIIGYGHIGRCLQTRLARLGIRSCSYDPWVEVATTDSLERVIECPVVSLHAELTDKTPWPSRHMLTLQQLQALPRDALLINAARGELIATEVLLALSDTRPDIGLVLDCWEREPAISNDLLRVCRFGTPHIAGYSADGKWRATAMLYHAACDALSTQVSAVPAALPPLDIEAPSGLMADELLPWLVGQVYDVREDDEALRRSPLLFDQLRKQYRQRRELRALRLNNPALLDEAALSICTALGVERC
ncbi:MAG: 4-phosphoerythronate dehydrogenase [Pseudomonadota bacterium]